MCFKTKQTAHNTQKDLEKGPVSPPLTVKDKYNGLVVRAVEYQSRDPYNFL